jgi:hypothetical protein
MKANKVIPILILISGGLLFLWSLMIPVDKYPWEPLLKQRNDLGISALRMVYSFLLVTFGGGYLLARMNSKAWVKCAYIAALIMVFYRLLEVFSI